MNTWSLSDVCAIPEDWGNPQGRIEYTPNHDSLKLCRNRDFFLDTPFINISLSVLQFKI